MIGAVEKGAGLIPLRRGFAALKLCAGRPEGVSFSEFRELLEPIAPGVMSRLLKALVAEGALRKNAEGLYACGPFLADLAAVFRPELDPGRALSARLSALSSDSGLSSAFFELRDEGLFLAAKSEVADGFHYIDLFRQMGNVPRHFFSQIALVFGGERARKALGVDRCILKEKTLACRLREIRRGSMAFHDIGGGRGIFRVGAPVFRGHEFRGIVGVSTYVEIKDDDRLRKICGLVRDSSKTIGD